MSRDLYFGSRGWTNREVIRRQMLADDPEVVIEGEADGADKISRLVAEEQGRDVEPYPVNTRVDGPWPAAGNRRNQRMLDYGRPRRGRGFVTGRCGELYTDGSADMIRRLQKAGVPYLIIREDGPEVPRTDIWGAVEAECPLQLGRLAHVDRCHIVTGAVLTAVLTSNKTRLGYQAIGYHWQGGTLACVIRPLAPLGDNERVSYAWSAAVVRSWREVPGAGNPPNLPVRYMQFQGDEGKLLNRLDEAWRKRIQRERPERRPPPREEF